MGAYPEIVIDYARVKANLDAVFSDSRFQNVSFRPHFKTHRSTLTGELFRHHGITKITVSSLPMAQYFAEAGWTDILIAMPLNVHAISLYNDLAKNIRLHLMTDHAEALETALQQLEHPVSFYLKADAGYGRAGIHAEKHASFLALMTMIKETEKHHFGGIMSHFGHTYHASSTQEIKDINLSSLSKLRSLKTFIESETGHACCLSIGDTPSLPVYTSEMLHGVNELRPGNFVYYDMMQVALGTCLTENIALALKTCILSLYPERNEALVHAGSIHLSKESCIMPDGRTGYGALVMLNQDGMGDLIEGSYVDRLSQEHGMLRVTADFFRRFRVGDTLGILPVHSCLVTQNPDQWMQSSL